MYSFWFLYPSSYTFLLKFTQQFFWTLLKQPINQQPENWLAKDQNIASLLKVKEAISGGVQSMSACMDKKHKMIKRLHCHCFLFKYITKSEGNTNSSFKFCVHLNEIHFCYSFLSGSEKTVSHINTTME